MKRTRSLMRFAHVGAKSSQPNPPTRCARKKCATRLARIARCAIVAVISLAGPLTPAANIVWVSDSNDPAGGFFGPLSGQTDSAWITLLQNAGHNVIRFNLPNVATTLLTQPEIDAFNTNDLIIIGRCVGSGAFATGQGNQWNTMITKPIIDQSAYHARTDSDRLGWILGNTSDNADDTPTPLKANITGNPAIDSVVDYLFSGVVMNGTNTAIPFDEAMDRNTSHLTGNPVAGGVVYATANYIQQNATTEPFTMNFGNVIVGVPAGTAVRNGADILGGYRMFFAGGSREGNTAPNGIPLYAGRENFTATGEDIFLRAVQVALNNGVAPETNTGPASITTQPVSLTVTQGAVATFSIVVAGAAPRTVQWQRDDGSGTFVDIPGTLTPFLRSAYTIVATNMADNGARLRVVAGNGQGTVTSDVVTLTINQDTAPPVPISAASLDGTSITVCFNEEIDAAVMADPSGFQINGGSDIIVTSVSFPPDGRSANLALSGAIGATATVDFFNLADRYGNVVFAGPTLTARNFGFSAADVGTVTPPGSEFMCATNSFQVTAGGVDIGSTADNLHFVYKSVDGDFDARVRVTSFVGSARHFETTAKAMLLARVDNSAGSPSVNVWITPSYPGDDNVTGSYRSAAGAATNTFGTTLVPNGLPNAWMRIQRVGDEFTTYRSVNGVDWTTLGSATLALGGTLNVGVGVISHRPTAVPDIATATFSDFTTSGGSVLVPTAAVLTNATFSAGQFSASFQSQSGITYTVEYKNDLNTVAWTTLTTIPGDGTLKTFTDPGPLSPTGNRFYRVSAQ